MPEWMTPELRPVWCSARWPSFSSTATVRPGNRRASWYATASPTMPPPITATSACFMGDPLLRQELLPRHRHQSHAAQVDQRPADDLAVGAEDQPLPAR